MKFKPEKHSGLDGIRTHDLCDTDAVLWTIKQLEDGHIVSSESQQGQLEFRIHWEFRTAELRNVQKTKKKNLYDTSS